MPQVADWGRPLARAAPSCPANPFDCPNALDKIPGSNLARARCALRARTRDVTKGGTPPSSNTRIIASRNHEGTSLNAAEQFRTLPSIGERAFYRS